MIGSSELTEKPLAAKRLYRDAWRRHPREAVAVAPSGPDLAGGNDDAGDAPAEKTSG